MFDELILILLALAILALVLAALMTNTRMQKNRKPKQEDAEQVQFIERGFENNNHIPEEPTPEPQETPPPVETTPEKPPQEIEITKPPQFFDNTIQTIPDPEPATVQDIIDIELSPIEEIQEPEPSNSNYLLDAEEIEEEPPKEIPEIQAAPITEIIPELEEPETLDIKLSTAAEKKPRTRKKRPIINENDPQLQVGLGVRTCRHCSSDVPDTIYCINCGKSLDEET